MKTLSTIIESARKAYANLEVKYVHPTLYLVVVDEAFSGLEEDKRALEFQKRSEISIADLQNLGSNSTFSLILATGKERHEIFDFLDRAQGQHWLPFLDAKTLNESASVAASSIRAMHFYGYKGGQARSSVLAMIACQLANDGYKVLVVDADVEAPSLDHLFGVVAGTLNQTLIGIASGSAIEPISAFTGAAGGKVDLVACRPAASEYDMDFASFTLRTALDVTALQDGLTKFLSTKTAQSYDVFLFDHRSGVATSVLPIMAALPGPAVICLRLDAQSERAAPFFDILFRQTRVTPGAYISFSLDPEDSRDKMLRSRGSQVTKLLDLIGSAVERGSTEYADAGLDLPPEDFLRYWIPWLHDRAFLEKPLPQLEQISEANRRSLHQLREVTGFSGKLTSTRVRTRARKQVKLAPSGSLDDGIFIETPDISKLLQPNTGVNYIFGRKGTGKTRLVSELAKRRLGEALIVAADSDIGGLSSSDSIFLDLEKACQNRPEDLWWTILEAALATSSTSSKDFKLYLIRRGRELRKGGEVRLSDIATLAAAQKNKRVFLIDGIETAFRANVLIDAVEALFRFMLTLQSDTKFAERISIRLFLRTDLARRGIQNIEQQTSGRRLDLTWNTQSIFNFVLSRISQIDWFRQKFSDACADIDAQRDSIKAGMLSEESYEPLLLEIFPQHLRRNNLQTLTFLKTYFSDAGGDEESKAAFYPRLFDSFLHKIAEGDSLENGLVHQSLVLSAHDAASRSFLDEVKQELTVLLQLASNPTQNGQRVTELLQAFDGLRTPFELEDCIKRLRNSAPGIKAELLREALTRMKEIGMFEDRPGYSGWWRAGRLFKSALRMKYVR